MKKIISLCMSALIALTSISANALSEKKLELLKEEKQTGWFFDKESQQNYYFKNGDMIKNDWILLNNGHKYYLKEDGTTAKGWIFINNSWYYFLINGDMHTGWLKDGLTWYYLNQDGTMAHDTYIGNYYIGSNGAWVQ